MRRRLFAVLVGCLSAFTLAGTVLADTGPGPGPGNFRDSGSQLYLNASSAECDQSMCTETYVNAWVTTARGGDTITTVCMDHYTYPAHGGGRFTALFGCNEVDATIDIASDLSSGSVDAVIVAEECDRHDCSIVGEVSVSADLTAVSGPNAYSYTSKNQFENCIDTYRVRGENSEAQGSIVVDGTTVDAYGQLGAETFAFSTRCR